MTDQSIPSLIERLEKASGPDRDLDGAIAVAVGPWTERHGLPGPWVSKGPNHAINEAPHFTASLDAALTLVPEGWIVVSMKNGDLDRKYYDIRASTKWSVIIARNGHKLEAPSEVLTFPSATHESPAIALCIAALKAREHATLRAREALG